MSKIKPYLCCLLLALAFSANANPGSSTNPNALPSIATAVSPAGLATVHKPENNDASNAPLFLSIVALILSCGNIAYTIRMQHTGKKTGTAGSNCIGTVDTNSNRDVQRSKIVSTPNNTPTPKKKGKKKGGKQSISVDQDHVAIQDIPITHAVQSIVQDSSKTPLPSESVTKDSNKVDKPSTPPQKQPQTETYYTQPRINGATIVLIDAGEQNRVYAPLKIVSQKGRVDVYFNEDSLINNLVNIEKSILPYVETGTLNANSPKSVVTIKPGVATPQNGYWILTRKPNVEII